MLEGIKAVAFDIDGTMYADWRLHIRMPFYFLRHIWLFFHFGRVRVILRRTAPVADFYEYQARLLAKRLRCSPEEAKEKLRRVCYDGLSRYFESIKPYPYLYETVAAFKSAGLKIGVLSDFPPGQKGPLWGVRDLCDVCIGSEESGALKPSVYPFGILARKLNLSPSEILYVGNSKRYDVGGANSAGMKSAYLQKGIRALFNIPLRQADISFKNYRQLKNIVLQ